MLDRQCLFLVSLFLFYVHVCVCPCVHVCAHTCAHTHGGQKTTLCVNLSDAAMLAFGDRVFLTVLELTKQASLAGLLILL